MYVCISLSISFPDPPTIPTPTVSGCCTRPFKLIALQVPLDSVDLDELSDALKGLAGAGSTATSCTVRVRVTSMLDRARFSKLKAKGLDYVDCMFKATGVVGQGTGTVQLCDLSRKNWYGTTGLNFTIQSVDSPVNTGPGSAISNTLPVIDDFRAIGTLNDDED